MTITAPPLPFNPPTPVVPLDILATFSLGQVVTASGPLGNQNTSISMGGVGGRFQGQMMLELSAINLASGNEFYQFSLLGSNDPNFGAGNSDLLAFYDIAATAALRLTNTSLLTPAAPLVAGITTIQQNALQIVVPFTNQRGQFSFEFFALEAVVGGTGPSITVSAWCAPWSGQKM